MASRNPLSMAAVALALGFAVPAFAELCPECRPQSHTKDIGTCSQCKSMTASGQFQLCKACSERLRECEQCRRPLPSTGAVVVKVKVMTPDGGSPPEEEWIRQEMKAMQIPYGVGTPSSRWIILGKERLTIHDSKHFGQLYLSVKDPGGNAPLRIEITGSHPATVEIPRTPGSHRLVQHTIASSIASRDYYFAFTVEERGLPGVPGRLGQR